MNDEPHMQADGPNPGSGKPCVALMGEFSAGKSTLSNLLIGARSLPVQVTATQLPPVWISQGDQPPYRVDLEGTVSPIDLNELGAIDVGDTSYVRIFRNSPVLGICDVIDMPGISDPSMAADVWQRVIHHADMVVWCSHATQAWRQSEAAVWDSLPPTLYEKSLLLLTRMDKITSERDRMRVLKRVERETQGLFSRVMPISLLQALNAGDDAEAWAGSGAQDFIAALRDRLESMSSGRPVKSRPISEIAPRPAQAEEAPEATGGIMPKRVVPRTGIRAASRRGERPAASAAGLG